MEDNTQLVATFQITELVGAVSLLYGMLLHSGAPSRGQTPPPQLSHATLTVIASSLHMLNHFAVLDLNSFQVRERERELDFVVGGLSTTLFLPCLPLSV